MSRLQRSGRAIRLGLALTLLAALTISGASSAAAGGRKILDATMVGLNPPGTVVAGITGAGAPWVIENGRALLFEDGRIHVVVAGLVIPGRVPPNPVPMGKAVVSCNGAFADDTAVVAFSPDGDAVVDDVVTLPSPCRAPAVFFTSPTGAWFAVTGA
jgi:hypothetical protein